MIRAFVPTRSDHGIPLGATGVEPGMDERRDLRDVLADQNGSLTREQALACGLSPSAIGRRVARGDWRHGLPRVLEATDRPADDRERIRRAGLWAGDSGTVAGLAGATWWHLHDVVPERIRVIRPPGASNRAPAGIAVRRALLAPEDRLRVDGIMATRRDRTVLDAAVDLGLIDGARLMDRALQQGSVAVGSLADALERRVDAWGTPLARQLLALADGGARSEAERRALAGLRAAGLRGVPNLPLHVPGWGEVVLDIAFPAARLVVEVDGWAFHRDVERFRRDAGRQNALVLAGWTVLRVTWYDVRSGTDALVHQVRTALAVAAVTRS